MEERNCCGQNSLSRWAERKEEGFRADFRGGEVFWLARGRTMAFCIFSPVGVQDTDAWTTEEGRWEVNKKGREEGRRRAFLSIHHYTVLWRILFKRRFLNSFRKVVDRRCSVEKGIIWNFLVSSKVVFNLNLMREKERGEYFFFTIEREFWSRFRLISKLDKENIFFKIEREFKLPIFIGRKFSLSYFTTLVSIIYKKKKS